MPKIPGIKYRQAVKAFQKAGFFIKRQSGHLVMSNGTTRITIPRHNPIHAVTMGNIAKDAG